MVKQYPVESNLSIAFCRLYTGVVSGTFEFSGGALCLDFVNTLGDRPLCRNEKLRSPSDLLRWAQEAGVLPQDGPREFSEPFLHQAIEMRERLFRVFSGLSEGHAPAPQDLAALNADLGAALGRLRLEPGPGRFAWTWDPAVGGPERVLGAVVRSAAELLASEEAAQVKVCGSDRCSWLFVDRSRTHRRRWCEMKSCGNRAKARRHYQRRKAGREAT